MKRFKLPEDVLIKFDENIISISRGVINYQEINIDKIQSSPLFVSVLEKLYKDKLIEVSNPEIIKDLTTLSEMGYLEKILPDSIYKNILFVVDEVEYKYYSDNLPKNVDLMLSNKISNDNSFIKLLSIEDKNEERTLMDNITNKYKLKKYNYIVYVDTYYHASRIRIFNKIIKYLDIYSTFAISDYSLMLITTIKHGETGCFECLENQMQTKINSIDILRKNRNRKDFYSLSLISLKFGFVLSILDNIIQNKNTNTLGNVIEYDSNTKEYYFDNNRIQTSCKICSTQNNAFHEEQNMKTVNILNSLGD